MISVTDEDIIAATKLNEQQKDAYDQILNKVFRDESTSFFIDGHGGTGKTFLYRAILATVKSKKIIALATTSSEVDASILPGGGTAHSRFKFSLQLENKSTCNITKESSLAKLLQMTKIIIWDESPMINKYAVEALDNMQRDVTECDLPFGGKVIVLGGDFCQVLPVIPQGKKEEIFNASSPLLKVKLVAELSEVLI
ncbi:ATP-dependent DNA helicase pfh1-like [Humulus lupulus]|uniref:ATP-dependent DNA helicase pfh1-like n=1 Tax=Humulus lupulus TaxID=3486 RepID=UPI002B4120A4|nr:ATP-dependent DNA helicase pfh1-like [Humulus lupulus]